MFGDGALDLARKIPGEWKCPVHVCTCARRVPSGEVHTKHFGQNEYELAHMVVGMTSSICSTHSYCTFTFTSS